MFINVTESDFHLRLSVANVSMLCHWSDDVGRGHEAEMTDDISIKGTDGLIESLIGGGKSDISRVLA